jgi:hypothetical protein
MITTKTTFFNRAPSHYPFIFGPNGTLRYFAKKTNLPSATAASFHEELLTYGLNNKNQLKIT